MMLRTSLLYPQETSRHLIVIISLAISSFQHFKQTIVSLEVIKLVLVYF